MPHMVQVAWNLAPACRRGNGFLHKDGVSTKEVVMGWPIAESPGWGSEGVWRPGKMDRLPPSRLRRWPSFTLVESLIAIGLTAMAGAAVLAGVYAALHTGQRMLLEAVATGLAEQWMDEIFGCRYHELGGNPYSLLLGPDIGEKMGQSRCFFDDLDDYHELLVEPPLDRWGIPLGHDGGKGGKRHPALVGNWPFLKRFSIRSQVRYVRKEALGESLSPGSFSDYRAIEVEVGLRQASGGVEPLCRLRRVTAYLPPL